MVKIEEKEKKVKKFNGIKEKKKNNEEIAPIEYIHVRARRGQATDSHSLAERVIDLNSFYKFYLYKFINYDENKFISLLISLKNY